MQNKVYSEVLAVLGALGEKFTNSIPAKLIDLFNSQKNAYIPIIDVSKPLDKQGLDNNTITIIALLKLNYWCDDIDEKIKLLQILEKNERELNDKIRESDSIKNVLTLIRKNK